MENNFLLTLFRSWGATGWMIVSFFLLSVALVMIEPLQNKLFDGFKPRGQTIISVADNKFSRNSPVRQVLKISTPTGFILEVYGPADQKGNRKILQTILLQDRHDAYYEINGRSTNLAFRDMDNDGYAEIIAPTYDDDWNPRLNVFRYDKETEEYTALNE